MKYKTLFAVTFLFPFFHFCDCLAQGTDADSDSATENVTDLADFGASPDGVSILSMDGDSFKILSIATAPYQSATSTLLSAARTVAVTKAKGALSRFLNETVNVEDYLEKEVSKVKVVSEDGVESAGQIIARNVLTRIKTQSKSLLSGALVLKTERIPAKEGTGGSLRVIVGISSNTLAGSEHLDAGIEKATP